VVGAMVVIVGVMGDSVEAASAGSMVAWVGSMAEVAYMVEESAAGSTGVEAEASMAVGAGEDTAAAAIGKTICYSGRSGVAEDEPA
jgi:hypothetical protein